MEKVNQISGTPKFNDFVKYPLHVVLYLLLSYFIYKEFTNKDECVELRKIVLTQEGRIRKLENDKDELTNALLVKNGIFEQIKKNTDSLVREKVGNEAAEIIKK